jgi:hypothetical protein
VTARIVIVRGERHLTLTEVARCYRIEVTVLREAYEYGLLGEGEPYEDDVTIPIRRMERVAEILRLRAQVGVNVEGILLLVKRGVL